jgi:Cupin domain
MNYESGGKRFLVLNYGDRYEDRVAPQFTEVTYWHDNFVGAGNFVGFVERDTAIAVGVQAYFLKAGMYFSCSYPRVFLNEGSGIIFRTKTYVPQFLFGGPVEDWGRLKYIDGCTDSLLIPPVKFGDPCLNALYFPPGINQTQHTHPSLRAGLVIRGRGECVTPEARTPLEPGVCFIIETDGLHYFRTPEDSSMTVIAFHPDSDMGPKDDDHPMVNRTIVEGVSASKIDAIRTK